ncbi:MAG: ATP-binding protein [Methanophagales archaeon ANME-1-THS]|nr:MAG: ATP-binding protein [Methanophagales archaeon ANME-1-THS]
MKKGRVIAVAGKGGTGKTAIAALLIRELLRSRAQEEICVLAVDADPDSNLPEALGISYAKTVGDIREALLEEKQRDAALDIWSQFEGKIAEIIVEEEHYDLLVMGRPEGPGCYCPVNHIIRMLIDTLTKNYDYTVIDCEAGLEHLSRRTTRDVDLMLVVLDMTLKSLKTALRLKQIAEELHVDVTKLLTIANKIPPGAETMLRAEASQYGLEIEEVIPFDAVIQDYDFKGIPLVKLPDDAPSVIAVRRIAERIK